MILALLLLVAPVQAREVRVTHDVSVDTARAALVNAGFTVNKIFRVNEVTVIDVPAEEARDPAAVVRAMKTRAVRRQEEAVRVDVLVEKLEAGQATAAEKDELLIWLVRRLK